MNRDARRIDSSCRRQIEQARDNIRCSNGRMFSGDGYPFKAAISQLRKSGMNIVYHRKTGDYQVVESKAAGIETSEQSDAAGFKAGRKYFAHGFSKGEFVTVDVWKVTKMTVFFIDHYGEKRSKRFSSDNDSQTFEFAGYAFTSGQEITEEFEAAMQTARQERAERAAAAKAKTKTDAREYRIVKDG